MKTYYKIILTAFTFYALMHVKRKKNTIMITMRLLVVQTKKQVTMIQMQMKMMDHVNMRDAPMKMHVTIVPQLK